MHIVAFMRSALTLFDARKLDLNLTNIDFVSCYRRLIRQQETNKARYGQPCCGFPNDYQISREHLYPKTLKRKL